MADVSHTSPKGASADRVWERGGELADPRTDGGETGETDEE